MSVDPKAIQGIAASLRKCGRKRTPDRADPRGARDGGVEAAYAVQQANTDHYLKHGRRLVGRKIGLTSKSVQKQLGVDSPDFGMLFADMALYDGEEIDIEGAAAQGRSGGRLRARTRSHQDRTSTLAELVSAVAYALPAVEIVGSRIENWNIKLLDTIADNASSGLFVLGTQPRKLDALDLRLCGMAMERRGEPVSFGAGAACLGNPLNAALWLARTMVDVGGPLKAGDIIMSGALDRWSGCRRRRTRYPDQRARYRTRGVCRLTRRRNSYARHQGTRKNRRRRGALRQGDSSAFRADHPRRRLRDPEGECRRRYSRGENQVGIKMGFTSREKMVQMGVHDMIWGRLTDAWSSRTAVRRRSTTCIRGSSRRSRSCSKGARRYDHPMQALSAVEAVAPAVEIIDSRYQAFKFSLTDVVADNSSSSGFVVGPWHNPISILESRHHRVVQRLAGARRLDRGDPRESVAFARLRRPFRRRSRRTAQGGMDRDAGGASHAEALGPGIWVECEVQNLGRCAFSVME